MDIYTYDPVKGKRVKAGWIDGDTFYRIINPKKHYIYATRGYGMQKEVRDILMENEDVKWIVFKIKKPKKTFKMAKSKLTTLPDVPHSVSNGNQVQINLKDMKDLDQYEIKVQKNKRESRPSLF